MLKKLTIHGFKSIERQTIALGALNVLIGANGSGKSNLLAALAFFRASALGDRDWMVERAGGADRVLFHGKKNTKACFFACESASFHYEQTLLPVAGDRLELDKDSGVDTARQAIEGWRIYHLHDTSATAAVKSHCHVDDNRYLREDSANLAAYLYWLKQKHPTEYGRIVATIQLTIPYFEDFVLAPLRRNEQMIRLEWKQRHSDAYFDADSLSDGSLRFVSLVTLLNQPPWSMPSLIVIDEPELGLHPLAIRLLAEMLDAASEHTQILLATQSVTLLDHFPLEQVIVTEHDGKSSIFRRLNSADYQAWLDNYSTGALWEKNVLGGRP